MYCIASTTSEPFVCVDRSSVWTFRLCRPFVCVDRSSVSIVRPSVSVGSVGRSGRSGWSVRSVGRAGVGSMSDRWVGNSDNLVLLGASLCLTTKEKQPHFFAKIPLRLRMSTKLTKILALHCPFFAGGAGRRRREAFVTEACANASSMEHCIWKRMVRRRMVACRAIQSAGRYPLNSDPALPYNDPP